MLQSLYLRDFVIVKQAQTDFSAGFCALSGETGAGKSILLDALGLVLGERADTAAIRPGCNRTELSAVFEPNDDTRGWLEEHGLGSDEPELLLRRSIDTQGRSRAFINGSPVNIKQLRELGAMLLEIHGQHAAQSLLQADGQRRLLDSYAGALPGVALLHDLWRDWRESDKALQTAINRQSELGAEAEQLSWQLEQIVHLELSEGEWENLGSEQSKLANASSLIEAARDSILQLTDQDHAIRDQLIEIINRIRSGAQFDHSLNAPLDMLESAQIQVGEASSDLSSYLQTIDADPARLDHIDSRLSDIFDAARKLRVQPESLSAHGELLSGKLAGLERDQDLDTLRALEAKAKSDFTMAAEKVSKLRRKASVKLAKQVKQRLGQLGMGDANFDFKISTAEPGPNGIDKIEILFCSHKSLPLRPLAKVASGGELSRLSLAIAVCAAQSNPVPTLIFDEADAGVGGAVADAIGRLMRDLGENRQVMAVTHLAQVAARAHGHYLVTRSQSKGQISSEVRLLSGKERIEETARMIGGAKVTATTRRHASELIHQGDASRAEPKASVPAAKSSVKKTAHCVSSKNPGKSTSAVTTKKSSKASASKKSTARPKSAKKTSAKRASQK